MVSFGLDPKLLGQFSIARLHQLTAIRENDRGNYAAAVINLLNESHCLGIFFDIDILVLDSVV